MHPSFRSRCLASASVMGLCSVTGAASAQTPAPVPAPPSYAPPQGYTAPPPAGPYAPVAPPQAPYAPYAPPAPSYLPPAYTNGTQELWHRKSTTMIGVGAALFGVGTIGALVGSAVLTAGAKGSYDPYSCEFATDYCYPARRADGGRVGAGAAMIAIGTIAVAVGIPVFAVGLKKVPNTPPAGTSLLPAVRVGATGADLAWRF